jgi:hypothetical protein
MTSRYEVDGAQLIRYCFLNYTYLQYYSLIYATQCRGKELLFPAAIAILSVVVPCSM